VLLPSAPVRRVSVVGTSGAGKSTLSRALAGALDAECLELDSVFHQPGWVPLPREEFRQRVTAVVAGERWVIDGNYTSQVKDLVWARADTVVWLDLPRRTVMRRIIWRSFRRAAARTELWNGNRERWRNFFSLDKEESVIAWAWQTHAATGPSWRRPWPIRGPATWSSFGLPGRRRCGGSCQALTRALTRALT
jgi:adenylate kinase family enzyme